MVLPRPKHPTQTVDVAWRKTIQDLAVHVSPQVGEPWKPYRWAVFVCKAIQHEMRTRPGGARIVVSAPPRTGKSELVSHWLPVWFLELFPKLRVVLASYEARLAERYGRRVRDTFERCPELWTKVRADARDSSDWETTEGGGMRTVGVGGGLTGMGGNCLIVDDPCRNWADAHSPVRQETERYWFDSTFYTRRNTDCSHIVILQTRWAESDMTGWLLKEHLDNWLHIRLPALAEAGDVLGRAEGESLCPERVSQEAYERTKKVSIAAIWAGMYQQSPIPAEGSIIPLGWLRYYDQLPSNVVPVGISVDASFKATETGSYVVLQAWGRDRHGCGPNFYLLNQVRSRMDFAPTVEALKVLMAAHPQASAKWIEEKANGAAIISSLRQFVPGLIPINPEGGKVSRLQAVAPFFKAGNVHLPRHAPWLPDYITELTYFPNASNDDQVDATSQALTQMGLGLSADLSMGEGVMPEPRPEHQHPKFVDAPSFDGTTKPEEEGPMPQEPDWRPKQGLPTFGDMGYGTGKGGGSDPMF